MISGISSNSIAFKALKNVKAEGFEGCFDQGYDKEIVEAFKKNKNAESFLKDYDADLTLKKYDKGSSSYISFILDVINPKGKGFLKDMFSKDKYTIKQDIRDIRYPKSENGVMNYLDEEPHFHTVYYDEPWEGVGKDMIRRSSTTQLSNINDDLQEIREKIEGKKTEE